MRTNAPTFTSWVLALLLFIASLLVYLGKLPQLGKYGYLLALIGLGLLLLAAVFKRL